MQINMLFIILLFHIKKIVPPPHPRVKKLKNSKWQLLEEYFKQLEKTKKYSKTLLKISGTYKNRPFLLYTLLYL